MVEVGLVAREVKKAVEGKSAEVHAQTFNGSIPGPLIICREGDFVELTLRNPHSNTFMHNIEFHRPTGGLGGGDGRSWKTGPLSWPRSATR